MQTQADDLKINGYDIEIIAPNNYPDIKTKLINYLQNKMGNSYKNGGHVGYRIADCIDDYGLDYRIKYDNKTITIYHTDYDDWGIIV